ncbi:unnamed protein product [Cuscuta epithymum]|uniref:Replication factor A C-terminal domain-containing protein n=1 Tax=Cuscuta epithymum TaxID=186058 RepID=A0AAV0E2R6_9ASTE|nr:unnamed protein product [Cuscuta epithymum]
MPTTNKKFVLERENVYWVLAEIVCIENFREWCCLSCPTCHKKLQPKEDRFWCTTCSMILAEGVYRYKISVCIMHNTGHGNFIIWDKECIEILGKASASLKVEVEQKTGDPTRFSKDIESLVDKKGIFKIQLRKKKAEENAYSDGISLGVVSIIRDTNVLAMYEQKEHLEINECDERTPEKERPPTERNPLSQRARGNEFQQRRSGGLRQMLPMV